MATKKLPSKAPGDTVDYPIDFAALLAAGESVVAATSVIDAGLTEESPAGLPPFTAAGVVTPVFSGGTEGETYRIVLTVTTDSGSPPRVFERSFCLPVEALS